MSQYSKGDRVQVDYALIVKGERPYLRFYNTGTGI